MLHYGRRWSQRWLRRHNEATKRASSNQSGQHYFLMTTCVLALLELGNGCSIYVDDDIRTMTGAIAMQTNFLHWWACILINYTVLATMPYPGSKSCRRGSAAVSWDGSVIMHLQTMEPAGGDQSFLQPSRSTNESSNWDYRVYQAERMMSSIEQVGHSQPLANTSALTQQLLANLMMIHGIFSSGGGVGDGSATWWCDGTWWLNTVDSVVWWENVILYIHTLQ